MENIKGKKSTLNKQDQNTYELTETETACTESTWVCTMQMNHGILKLKGEVEISLSLNQKLTTTDNYLQTEI